MHLCAVLILLLAFSSSSDAVVNGSIAGPGQFPFAVSLQWDGKHKCGGALINHDTVLTVVHCIPLIYVDPSQPDKATALLGARNQQQPEPGSLRVPISRYIVHPQMPNINLTWKIVKDLTFLEMPYDYALMKLARRVQPSRQIQFGRLAASNMPMADDECTVLGWGRFSYPDTNVSFATLFSPSLRQGQMRVERSTDALNIFINRNTMFLMSTIFRGDQSQGVICFGDSGTPIVCRDRSGQPYIGGMAEAAALPCNFPNISALFMKVDHLSPWIAVQNGTTGPTREDGSEPDD